ncbi:TerC family protein [Macrococcus equipercicus]|uniref:TerC family protein n=1 Tax=Macrococcus equipercicus TaxID=69967 RepID=A0A9Q9F1U9_9STAP|nr:TerC family protein [Macrococcus equipercicus]KAA1042611.1 TerC family protein [Macrococcus equipercicus]UTH14473.1 TerC family protein [Macrococcus equipercicus]
MDPSILLTYGWVVIVLVVLEGLLAADNAIVMAVMVKHLPEERRKKALFYGLVGAFVFRFISLFVISYLANIWEIQAIGAIYLLYISIKNLYEYFSSGDATSEEEEEEIAARASTGGKGFWLTVLKVELADIAFAIDSMLAAIAIAITLPHVGPQFGGMNAGQFTVMFIGGMLGVIIMRFAANWFVALLHKYPSLEAAAFAIVGWVGIKLMVIVLAHEQIGILPHDFPHSALWQSIFWIVLVAILAIGWFTGKKNAVK